MNSAPKRSPRSSSRVPPDKDESLKADIRFPGRILGDVIREQEGREAFVTGSRTCSDGTRPGATPGTTTRGRSPWVVLFRPAS